MTGAESTDGIISFAWNANIKWFNSFEFFLSELTEPRYNPVSRFLDNSLPP